MEKEPYMPSRERYEGKNGSGNGSAVLIGRSPKIAEVLSMIERVARTDIPILICGESGCGKEVVAQLIHLRSDRHQRPFLKVNCASIPRGLLESELFGYERGSFTGALSSKPGKFELAQGGTIFLDEISEMELSVQPKLLQVLQDRQFCRLGAHQEVTVDVRFISSTHRSLEYLLGDGRFRTDLYYRLNVITIQVPPLRERKEDLPDLVEHLVRKHSPRGAQPPLRVSDRLLDAFARYDWPGNIRELENAIRRLLALGEDSAGLDDFARVADDSHNPSSSREQAEPPILSLKEVAKQAAWEAEREMILLALERTNWNRKRAAELLNISYKAMLYKLKDAGLAKHYRTAAYSA
jgi:two-component system response regulator AtoC